MSSKILMKINDTIKGKAPISAKRSSHWVKTRAEFLKNNPKCAVCGGTKKLEVHHIEPFHINPELELEPTNLITLCEDASYGIICHLLVGHLGSYKSFNENVLEDAEFIKNKLISKKTLEV